MPGLTALRAAQIIRILKTFLKTFQTFWGGFPAHVSLYVLLSEVVWELLVTLPDPGQRPPLGTVSQLP